MLSSIMLRYSVLCCKELSCLSLSISIFFYIILLLSESFYHFSCSKLNKINPSQGTLSLTDFKALIECESFKNRLGSNTEALFTLLDEDNSGSVDKRELFAGLAVLLSHDCDRRTQMELLFAAYDFDDNEELDEEEFIAMLWAMVGRTVLVYR